MCSIASVASVIKKMVKFEIASSDPNQIKEGEEKFVASDFSFAIFCPKNSVLTRFKTSKLNSHIFEVF